jgi:hypothetical protein
MGTAGNRASTGVNVRDGGASLGGFTTQALPVTVSSLITPFIPATATTSLASQTSTLTTLAVGAAAAASPATFGAGANIAATINPSALNAARASAFLPASNFSAITISNALRGTPFVRRPSDEILTVSHFRINNGTFVPTNANGISSLRPEVVSMMDFKSVIADSHGSLTKAGKLLDLQFQAKSLREKTLLDLINNIRGNPDTAHDLDQIQQEFFTNFRTVDQLVAFYKNTIDTIEFLKQSFDVKNIPNNLYNTRVFQTLRSFYNHRMEFPINSFDQFSNTKLLYQLMFDFRAIMQNYSLNLLNLNDPDRTGDTNPISIDKSYTTTNGFSFTMDTVRSFGATSQNASDDDFFVRFLHTLPSSIDDRIKLLIVLLSKEFRISHGLGLPDVQRRLTDRFGAVDTNGNVFDNLIGTVGNTALDPPLGEASLSALFFLDAGNNASVLPFEHKYIDTNGGQRVYVPGTNYFVDSILNLNNNQFNTLPLLQYVETFTNRLASVVDIVEKLYDFKETQSPMSAVEVFKKFLLSMRHGMEGTGAGTQLSITQCAMVALFRLTAVDNELKEMLFQFILMKALQIQNSNRTDLRFITLHIINEIDTLQGLSFVDRRLDPGTDASIQNGRNLTPFMTQLAQDIQFRVFELLGVTISNGRVPVHDVVDPRTGEVRRGAHVETGEDQTNHIRGSAVDPNATGDTNHSPSDSTTRPVGAVRIRQTFDVDSTTNITSALLGDGPLLRGLIDAAMSLDVSASPGHNTATYVDSGGRTRYNQVSATTLFLMMYEIYCGMITKFTSCDFARSEQDNTCDILIDAQFNDVNMNICDDAISETEVVLSPETIGIIGPDVRPNVGVAAQPVAGVGAAPATTTVSGPGGARLLDIGLFAAFINPGGAAAAGGTTPGQAQGGADQNAATLGTTNPTPAQRTSAASMFSIAGLAQLPSYMLELRTHENSLYSIKRKVFEEDLAVANIIHILSVVYRRLANAQNRVVNFFNQSTLTNFLNQSTTAPSDLVNVLNPAQVKVIAFTKDTINNQLHASGDELGQQVGFASSTPSDINVKHGILSLLNQPDYQERFGADQKIKLLTIGVPAGFSKNLSDRINTNNINPTSFTTMKDFDVVEVHIHKRDLEHEELVFKPKIFLFDLSLFGTVFPTIDINEDFNTVIQNMRLLDYQNVSNPEQLALNDLNIGEKYSFLRPDQKLNMFKNHVVSDLLNSYINYMTAMRIGEDVFVDIHSDTYNQFNALVQNSQARRVRAAGTVVPPFGAPVNPLTTLTADFQAKVVRFLNIVKHKNLPIRPIQDLLLDPAVDEESKDILRTIAFGNLVFNPRTTLQRLVSPKLFDRVYTVPINVDAFAIDSERTNSTSVGAMVLEQLSQKQDTIITTSTGEIYLAPRDRHSPVFEDFFVTIDLTTVT